MSSGEILYLTALNNAFCYQSAAARALIDHFGTASEIFRHTADELHRATALPLSKITRLLSNSNLKESEKEVEWSKKQGIQTYAIHDPSYPKRLFHCPDAPVILYSKGVAELSPQKALAIVGTRSATPYGINTTAQIVQNLAARGHRCTIISGLAYGIDIAAHQAALKAHLPTIAVFASGLDCVQPVKHFSIAQKIVQQGACVSDSPSNTTIAKVNFIKRNRIIAGLSDGVLVVESKEKGGALITAQIAQSYDREVMALPGRWSDPCSKGCNTMIKKQQAILVSNVEDIEQQLNWAPALTNASSPPPNDLIDAGLLQALEKGPLSIDQLHRTSQLPLSELSIRLMNLTLKGLIHRLQQNQYCLC